MRHTLYLLPFLMALTTSCSSVDPKRYKDFNSSVVELNTAFESSFQNVQKKSREHSIQKFALSPLSRPADLMISTDGYNWSMDKPPLYLTIKKTYVQLAKMNDLFEEYVNLLVQLSSASLTKEQLVSSAKDLDKRSNELAQTIGLESDKKEFTMISSATVGILQAYIDSKKEKKLNEAIKKNQPSVEDFSGLQIKLIQILTKNLKLTYNEEFFEAGKKWKDSNSKNQISSNLFDFNDSLIATLSIYEGLERGYRAIPQAHKDLAKTKDSKSFRSKIDRIVKSSNKILELQKDVSKKEGSK